MLEDYYVKPSTIDRVRASWLAPQIESYLEWLEALGYSRLVANCASCPKSPFGTTAESGS